MKKLVSKLVPPLFGAAVGTLATLVVVPRIMPQEAPWALPTEPRAPGALQHPEAAPVPTLRKTDDVANALLALAQQRAQHEERGHEEADEERPPPREPSGEEEQRSWATLIEQIDAEPMSDWSAGAGSALQKELTALGEDRGFSVREATCHTDRCKALVEWNGETSTPQGVQDLATHAYSINCVTSVEAPSLVPGSSDRWASHVVIDCKRERGPELAAAH